MGSALMGPRRISSFLTDLLGTPVDLLLSPQSDKTYYFRGGPIGADPICPQLRNLPLSITTTIIAITIMITIITIINIIITSIMQPKFRSARAHLSATKGQGSREGPERRLRRYIHIYIYNMIYII